MTPGRCEFQTGVLHFMCLVMAGDSFCFFSHHIGALVFRASSSRGSPGRAVPIRLFWVGGGMIMKIDLEKAYEKISRPFLRQTLIDFQKGGKIASKGSS